MTCKWLTTTVNKSPKDRVAGPLPLMALICVKKKNPKKHRLTDMCFIVSSKSRQLFKHIEAKRYQTVKTQVIREFLQ